MDNKLKPKIEDILKVHIIGIGGSGVSGLAYWFLDSGCIVSGSDRRQNEVCSDLIRLGVNIKTGHSPEGITKELDLVIYSPAIPENNPELMKARELNIYTLSHFEAVALVSEGYKVVAVTGTNGKSTTTAMLASIVEAAGLDPAVMLGSRMKSWRKNSRHGNGRYFIVEADDYKRKFLSLHPAVAVVTNIEADHLDYYKDIADVKSAFGDFLSQVRSDGTVILNSDDKNTSSMSGNIPHEVKKISYGKTGNYVTLSSISDDAKDGTSSFSVKLQDGEERSVIIPMPGEHNIYNALAAYSAALALGIEPQVIERALCIYQGIERRFEFMGKLGKTSVYSDYGHHPSAIAQTVRGVRKSFPGKKILLVFQPHQHNRTRKLFGEFVESLIAAEPDALIISEIYDVAGRTNAEDAAISSKSLVEEVGQELPFVYFSPSIQDTEEQVREKAVQFDMILVMGAGDIHDVAKNIVSTDEGGFLSEALKAGLDIKRGVPLREMTTWKIGGEAKYLLQARTKQDLTAAISLAQKYAVKSVVMGGGSNVLVSDEGYDGLVVVNKTDGIKYQDETVVAASGVAMGRLAADTLQKGYSGLEWAIGLPGSVGGAVFGNSNCWGGSTGASLKSAIIWSSAEGEREVQAGELDFGYDHSKLQESGEIVLEATFRLKKLIDDEELSALREKIRALAKDRSEKQPLGAKVAGSVFKALKQTPEIIEKLDEKLPNWRDGLRDGFISAGFLIDKGLGLKGYRSGQVQISDLHANFFINSGDATAKNVRKVIDFVKERCKNKFEIELEEEIKYI